jgi:hypothetical protein
VTKPHPIGVGEILDIAVRLTVRHFGVLLRAVLVVALPVQLALLALPPVELPEPGAAVDGAQLAPAALALLGGTTASVLATGGAWHALVQAYMGRRPDWRASLRFALPRLLALLAVGLLTGLLVVVGLAALLVGAIYAGVALAVAAPALLGEGLGPVRALRRSRQLVAGRFWPVLGLLAVTFVLTALVGLLVGGGFVLLADLADSDAAAAVLVAAGEALAALVPAPFAAAVAVVLYVDLRVREGDDLRGLAERVGAVAPRVAFLPPLPPEPRRAPR